MWKNLECILLSNSIEVIDSFLGRNPQFCRFPSVRVHMSMKGTEQKFFVFGSLFNSVIARLPNPYFK